MIRYERRRLRIIQRDVVQEPRACEAALKKVVTQNAVVRYPVVKRRLKCVYVEYSLTAEYPFAKRILVKIRNGAAVGAHAAIIRNYA